MAEIRDFSCIVCPRSCNLHVESENGEIVVTGNTCIRGYDFAVSEMTCPKRSLCSMVKTIFADAPVLPVKLSADIPKEKIFDAMTEIRSIVLTERIGRGEVIAENLLGLGADLVSTSDILIREKIKTVREENA